MYVCVCVCIKISSTETHRKEHLSIALIDFIFGLHEFIYYIYFMHLLQSELYAFFSALCM